jgi:hypothetical protein
VPNAVSSRTNVGSQKQVHKGIFYFRFSDNIKRADEGNEELMAYLSGSNGYARNLGAKGKSGSLFVYL